MQLQEKWINWCLGTQTWLTLKTKAEHKVIIPGLVYSKLVRLYHSYVGRRGLKLIKTGKI